jgi:hypothetical protein
LSKKEGRGHGAEGTGQRAWSMEKGAWRKEKGERKKEGTPGMGATTKSHHRIVEILSEAYFFLSPFSFFLLIRIVVCLKGTITASRQ